MKDEDTKARADFFLIHSLDYLFQLAVEMKKLGIPWISDIARVAPDRP